MSLCTPVIVASFVCSCLLIATGVFFMFIFYIPCLSKVFLLLQHAAGQDDPRPRLWPPFMPSFVRASHMFPDPCCATRYGLRLCCPLGDCPATFAALCGPFRLPASVVRSPSYAVYRTAGFRRCAWSLDCCDRLGLGSQRVGKRYGSTSGLLRAHVGGDSQLILELAPDCSNSHPGQCSSVCFGGYANWGGA